MSKKKMLKELQIKRMFIKEQCIRPNSNVFSKSAYELVLEELDDLIANWERKIYEKKAD